MAQSPGTASIGGAFYDQHGGVLPEVDVTLTDERTNTSVSVRSDANGAFVFRDVAPGQYTMVSRLAGFAPVTVLIKADAGAQLQRSIMLPLGTLQETVTLVTDGSPQPPRATANTPRPPRAIPQPGVASPCVGNKIGGCIKTPRKVVDVKPVYPANLAASRIEGVVQLQCRVGIDGYVNDLRLVPGAEPATHPEFVAAAIEAVSQWEFNPTYLNGVPVEANMLVTVRFSATR
jgi:TonB family protein